MQEYNLQEDDIPKIVDYNNEENPSELEHNNLDNIVIDDTLIHGLKSLNLDNLLNVDLNGNENLKNNFQSLINAFQIQQEQLKSVQKYLHQEQKNTNDFRTAVSKNFRIISQKNKDEIIEKAKEKTQQGKIFEHIQRIEINFNKEKTKNGESVKDLNDVVRDFHIKFDKQKKENSNQEKEINSIRQKNNELIKKFDIQDQEIQLLKKELETFMKLAGGEEDDFQFTEEQIQQFQEQENLQQNINEQQAQNIQQIQQIDQIQQQSIQQAQIIQLPSNQSIQKKQSDNLILKMKIGQVQIEVENLKQKMENGEFSQPMMMPQPVQMERKLSQKIIQPQEQRKSSVEIDLGDLQDHENLKKQLMLINKRLDETVIYDQVEELRQIIQDKVDFQQFNELYSHTQNLNKQISQNLSNIKQNETNLQQQQKQKPQTQPQAQISDLHLQKINKIPEIEQIIKIVQQQINENLDIFRDFQKNTNENIDLIKDAKVDKDGYNHFDQESSDKINKQINDNLKQLRDNINRINQKSTNDECQMAMLEDRMNKIFISLNQLEKGVQDLQNDDTQEIFQKIEKDKQELENQINEIDLKLDSKSNKNDMNECEEVLLQKLDKCIEALMKKMADKNDTKKALLFLEKRINDLYQLSFEKKTNPEDDPLIAKRPLFWSCVSCDIDVEKYKGKLGEYKNWAVFPPKETAPDRMGRFGVGYYNMMRTRKLGNQNEKDNKMVTINLKDQNKINDNLNIKTIEVQEKEDIVYQKSNSLHLSQKSNQK